MSRPDHPIFHGPLPVDLALVQTPTPEGYSRWSLDELPATLPTLAILARLHGPDIELPEGEEKPVPGLVTDGDGLEDTPDVEVIAGGIHSKGPSYASIVRQGRLLQWGFAGAPDEMTEAGRNVFLNALHHVTKFADDPIVGFRRAESRDDVATALALSEGMEADQKASYLQRTFGSAVPEVTSQDRAARRSWFQENRPYLAYSATDGTFAIDEDAKGLGVANHDVALLKRCVEDLEAGRDVERAQRLLRRYTAASWETSAEWRTWLDAHADRLAFSDVAGYRFRSRDEGRVAPDPGALRGSADVVRFELVPREGDERFGATLTMRVEPGFHVYAPNAKEPNVVRLRLRAPDGAAYSFAEPPVLPTPPKGHISGHSMTELVLSGDGTDFSLLVDFQACTEKYCLPPVTGHVIRAAQ